MFFQANPRQPSVLLFVLLPQDTPFHGKLQDISPNREPSGGAIYISPRQLLLLWQSIIKFRDTDRYWNNFNNAMLIIPDIYICFN